MGVNMSGSWRRTPLPRGWSRIRRRILARDGGRCTHVLATDLVMSSDGRISGSCSGVDGDAVLLAYAGERCPSPATDVHHVGDRDDYSESNLVSLCSWHHDQIPNKRNDVRKKSHSSSSHPGLM